MGIVRRLIDCETWLSEASESWRQLSDTEYGALVRDWSARFRSAIERREWASSGARALRDLEDHLPLDVILFSGVGIDEIGNLGGTCAAAYRAAGLRTLDRERLRRLELILCGPDLSWTCLFSHETGSLFEELLLGHLGNRGDRK